MKGNTVLCLILLLCVICIPFLALGAAIPDKTSSSSSSSSSSQVQSSSPTSTSPPSSSSGASSSPVKTNGQSFKILDEKSKKILTVSDRDFLYGAIVTEMSPANRPEALKAQAVAAYTYYSHLRQQQKESPSSALNGADFSADTQNWEIYVSKDQMKDRWGSNFDSYYNKLTAIVDAVYGQTLQSDGELITSTYFAISAGKTESAKDIWGSSCSYLVPVASPGDVYAGGYQTTVAVTEAQFKVTAQKQWPKVTFANDASKWIGTCTRTNSGSVETVAIGNQTVKGCDVRSAFNLRSANFTVSYAKGKFTFIVKGWGHGVGMSQAGAEYMASQGSTYQQILAWYYPGTTLANE